MNIDLNGDWEFRALDGPGRELFPRVNGWLPATVPGTVHTDLMANSVIPDPFFRMNENDVQWVEEMRWIYRKTFQVPDALLNEERIWLQADGLDTYTTILLNGKEVGKTSNMFIANAFDIRKKLRAGSNTIEIIFESPVLRSRQIEGLHGRLRVDLEPNRVYVRKAQYSFGWDWGPKLTTSGIWRRIGVQAASGGMIRDPFVRIVSLNSKEGAIQITANLEGRIARGTKVLIQVEGNGKTWSKSVPAKANQISTSFRIPQPRLWWPNGYGDQPMYKAVLSLVNRDSVVHELSVSFALRTVKLLQEKDRDGKSFVMMVNGRKIFCKGACWIPADSFIPRIPDSRYETLLRMAKDAHMNMIRVWGGGVYESDLFYELCDRLGLMVWQDFMFACGEYPQTSWFLREVKEEAESVVKRLRNHPSIVLWCGNNECEWLYCMQNPGAHPDEMNGALIFRDLLPRACQKFDGSRPYWRSSPFGNGFPNDESSGNHHQWIVWSAWKDFRGYEQDNARFVTEFGFQGFPHMKTLEACTVGGDRHPQSLVVEHHNKQVEGPARLIRFMSGHYKVEPEISRFAYVSQLVQAEALKCGVEHWRRRKYRTAGALFWQLNDCWPVVSWAVIDSALRPKAAYYYAKRFLAPILVSFRSAGGAVEVWVTQDGGLPIRGTLNVSRRSFDGKIGWERKTVISVARDASKMVESISGKDFDSLRKESEYLLATLEIDNAIVAENRFFFAEAKHQQLSAAPLKWEISPESGGRLRVTFTATSFARGVEISVDGDPALCDDNYFDMEVGETRMIGVRSTRQPGELTKRISVQWLR